MYGSENVFGNPRLQRPNFTLKLFYFSVKFGLWNLGFPYTFRNPHGPYINTMYLVSSLHDMPYPIWGLNTPWGLRSCDWLPINFTKCQIYPQTAFEATLDTDEVGCQVTYVVTCEGPCTQVTASISTYNSIQDASLFANEDQPPSLSLYDGGGAGCDDCSMCDAGKEGVFDICRNMGTQHGSRQIIINFFAKAVAMLTQNGSWFWIRGLHFWFNIATVLLFPHTTFV